MASRAGELHQLVAVDDLDPRATARLAAAALVGVDRLPAGLVDQVGAALAQPGLDGLVVVVGLLDRRPLGEVGEQVAGGLVGVLLVGADDPGGPAFDPPDDVLARGAVDPSLGVRHGPRGLVEGHAGQRQPAVAHRAQHQPGRHGLALAGVDGTGAPVLAGLETVDPEHDLLDPALAAD